MFVIPGENYTFVLFEINEKVADYFSNHQNKPTWDHYSV